MKTTHYQPESYWNAVAEKIAARNQSIILAGDDEPYYHYKRKKFLKILSSISFNGEKVLELGCGPGGNLLELEKQHPAELIGADISDEMLELAKKNTAGKNIQLQKIVNGKLWIENNYFDTSLTSTVLQHITNEIDLQKTIEELCRVTHKKIIIAERIETNTKGTILCMGRTIENYASLFGQHQFQLKQVHYSNIKISYYVCGAIRKIFNSNQHTEATPASKATIFLQKIFLPFTSLLDKLFKSKGEFAVLIFEKDLFINGNS